ncbi:glycosyltransferase family 2 protein [Terrimonas sp. NA20]|uniref:Glycosyltransferase family 2 protein n=1 Tax=Terrimonas ginsenosidimutans TaxID=2908004 RepID=A0ABS9L096_9BACT|nr:glycosyltransferase family 2 protein [Terrimonas ginsenosidimutans]MCG2618003.1 glycosyltransferase family 2 protein [Terrimonas ginsenosidimutans]
MRKNDPSAALLISTYNWPEALDLVFQSILHQTRMPDEVIIADDGSGNETRKVIDAFREKCPVPVRHFWQHDDGFRKTEIINQVISYTDCAYIIQIDGDIILHPKFIEDHLRVQEQGTYIRASRVLLSEEKTKELLFLKKYAPPSIFSNGIKNRINALRLPLLAFFLTKRRRRSDNIHGSNCAYWRADFIAVNGYNNQMQGWGHEDIELAARLVNAGILQKRVKLLAIGYHLHHTYNDRGRAAFNHGIYLQVVNSGTTTCADGYLQVRKDAIPITTPISSKAL